MSSSIQKIHEDEAAWMDFCRKTGADNRWRLYSSEYEHAREQHAKYGYVDRQLRLAVQHAIQRDELQRQQALEWQELLHMTSLLEKYDNL